jgi:hypothetical protein
MVCVESNLTEKDISFTSTDISELFDDISLVQIDSSGRVLERNISLV